MPRTNADVQTWLAGQDPLRLVPLIDPVIESAGYQPRSLYAETTGAGQIFESPQCCSDHNRRGVR